MKPALTNPQTELETLRLCLTKKRWQPGDSRPGRNKNFTLPDADCACLVKTTNLTLTLTLTLTLSMLSWGLWVGGIVHEFTSPLCLMLLQHRYYSSPFPYHNMLHSGSTSTSTSIPPNPTPTPHPNGAVGGWDRS